VIRDACVALLDAHGFADTPLFVVPEVDLPKSGRSQGLLPPEAIQPLLTWMQDIGADPMTRDRLSARAVDGRLRVVAAKVASLAGAADGQWEAVDSLHQAVEEVYTAERVRFKGGLDRGDLFGGELLIRWQELLGTERVNALLSPDQGGKFRAGAREADAPPLRAALVAAVAEAGRAALDQATRTMAEQWSRIPGSPEPHAAGRTIDPVAAAATWLERLPGAVRDQTRSKRAGRAVAGAGIRGAALMLGVAAVAGKADGTEPATAAAHGVIRTLFGPEDATRLLAMARTGLRDACSALLERSADAHRAQLADFGVTSHLGTALREAEQEVRMKL
jgi:hypothetical protein